MPAVGRSVQRIRILAERVAQAAAGAENRTRRQLWKDTNDLRPAERAPVFCELYDTWPELLPPAESLSPDPLEAEIEYQLHQVLYKHELGDDDVVEAFVTVDAACNLGRNRGVDLWGLPVGQSRSADRGWIYSEHPLQSEQDLARIASPHLEYRHQETRERQDRAAELLGDILPVRVVLGRSDRQWAKLHSWASALCGMEHLYVSMVEKPQFVHELMRIMRDGILALMDECEAAGILQLNNTGRLSCDTLPGPDWDGRHVRFRNMWGRGESQEFDGVSPPMFQDFLLQYQIPVLARFGITNYGCCEDLTQKLQYLKAIPNLRQIICSSWTDLERVVAEFGERCAIEWRQKATEVIFAEDLRGVRRHLEEGLRRARGCGIQIMLDSVMTTNGNPGRLKEWVAVAKEAGAKIS